MNRNTFLCVRMFRPFILSLKHISSVQTRQFMMDAFSIYMFRQRQFPRQMISTSCLDIDNETHLGSIEFLKNFFEFNTFYPHNPCNLTPSYSLEYTNTQCGIVEVSTKFQKDCRENQLRIPK